jgi:molybdate-binding protein
MGDDAVAFLRAAGSGTRVVIRYALHDGEESATDALGYLSGTSSTQCVVATVRGLTTIDFADVIAAREVPPPPAPRER